MACREVWLCSGIINLGRGESTEGFGGHWDRVTAPPLDLRRSTYLGTSCKMGRFEADVTLVNSRRC